MRSALIAILVFALFVGTLSAATATGYFLLNLKNADKEPIENATVRITYYQGATFTFEKQEKFTSDKEGKVSAFIESLDNKNITVEIWHGGIYVNNTYKWINIVGSPLFITLPVRDLLVEVKDQQFRPVKGVGVIATGDNKTFVKFSNDYGIAEFEGLDDRYNYTVRGIYGICNCNNFTTSKGVWRSTLTITIPTNDLKIITKDERGNPIVGNIEIVLHALNKTVNAQTSEASGDYSLEQIPLTNVTINARYDYYLPPRTIELNSDYEQTFIFDLLPPKIEKVEIKPKQPGVEDVTVTAEVREENVYSSGIARVYLLYTVDKDQKQPLLMSKVDFDKYTTVIPAQKDGSVVTFRVGAMDLVNRSTESVEYKYNVTSRQVVVKVPGGESLVSAIILIFLIVVVGAIGYYFYKEKKRKEQLKQAAQQQKPPEQKEKK